MILYLLEFTLQYNPASAAFVLVDYLVATATFIPKPINRHPHTLRAID